MKHRRLATRYRGLNRGLDRAGRIQRTLLPVRPPSLEGYRFAHFHQPCDEVGGDFYDFVESKHGLIVIVSDVIGHGFEAALTTMLIKEICEETVASTTRPVDLHQQMNGRLHRVLPKGMFAAAAILKLTSPPAGIEFANAGLPYPFVLRAARKRVDQVGVAGFPFPARPLRSSSRSLRVSAMHLSSGDVLLVGSDGIHAIAETHTATFSRTIAFHSVSRKLLGRSGEDVIERLSEGARESRSSHTPAAPSAASTH